MSAGTVIMVIVCFLFIGGSLFFVEWSTSRNMDKKIDSERINRDYYNIPGMSKCIRCGKEAYLTTTVVLPAVETKTGKLNYQKFDTKLLYSVHCSSCSLGTAQCEDIATVFREWNESDFTRIQDKAGSGR